MYICSKENTYRMKKLIISTIALLLAAGMGGAQNAQAAAPATAQQDSLKHYINIGLDFLTHGEICGGGLPRASLSTEGKSAFIMGRVRILADYQYKQWLQTHLTIQNNAIWGMNGNLSLGLYEGWVKVTAPFGLFAQVGRIALSYDDERIIGTNDFAAASRSHDALRFGYEGHGHKAHAILAFNQNGDNVYYGTYYAGGAQPYKSMQTLWYHYDIPVFPLGVSLLFMNMGLQAGEEESVYDPPRTVYQQLYGGYLNYHPKYVTVEGAYYRQSGQHVGPTMGVLPIQAWMASAKAIISPSNRYGFVLGYDHLSGDDYVPVTYGGQLGMVRHEVIRGFTPINGSRTKFYGLLDYFYESAYINGFTPGLQNAFIGATGKPWKALDCGITYHYLAVATQLKDLSSTLGHSVDVQLGYTFNKFISLSVGYTYMMGTETMARLKQEGVGQHAHWGWFSLVVSPTIFSRKW